MRIPPSSLRRAMCLVASTALAVPMLGGTPAAHSRSVDRRVRGPFKIARGVTLKVVSYPSGPWQVRILTIHPQRSATLEQQASGQIFGTYKTVSRMGHANGAVAAVNGDFGSFSGYPAHWNLIDGTLRTSGIQQNQAFAIDDSGTRAWAGTAPNSIRASTAGGSFE